MSLLVENLKVRKGEFNLEVPRWEVSRGECVGIRGPSGSGKSTLLEAIAGFSPVATGKISVDGVEITALPPEKRRVAMVFQKSFLFPHLSVLENVAFAYRVKGDERGVRNEKALRWLERLKIPELRDRRSHEISGGQAQRVALARALATGFPVLLLDEPFSALDVSLKVELKNLIALLVKEEKICAVMVSHDPSDFPGRFITLKEGRIAL